MTHQHPTPFGVRWRARWIWHGRPAITTETATRPVLADPVDRVVLLRRAFDLAEVPATVPARIWSDGRHVVRVNGEEVARGPVRSDPRRAHYDVVDLAPHLRAGENVIAVVARHFGRATSWWMPAPPTYSLGAGGVVFEALVGDEWVVSDRSWQAHAGDAWTPVAVPGDVACLPLEWFDRRAYPEGWDRPGFDACEWRSATEIMPVHTGAHRDPSPPSEPFGILLPPVRAAFPGGATHTAELTGAVRRAAPAERDDPVDQVLADEAAATDATGTVPVLAFDLGRIAAGTARMVVRGAAPGTVIDAAAAEHLDATGALAPLGQHAGFRYVCAGDAEESFETLDVIGTRHLHVSVRSPEPDRMPEIALAVHDRHRPRPTGASFACSDPLLEQVYEVGLRTVDLCALDSYVDCPTREQRAWAADSVVHQMVDLVANPDWSMARWHTELSATPRADGMVPMASASDFAADDRTVLPDWSLHWVHGLHNLMRYTGDRDLVAAMLPVAERTVRWFEDYLRPDGLIEHVSGWVLLDWSSVYSQGCSSTLNALWARALEETADLAAWLGNEGTAAWARSRRDGVRDAFDLFWDEGRGAYIDHVLDGVPRRAAAQHPGATALAAGIVPADRVARVVAGVTDRSRLIRHSFVMDPVTPEGDSSGYIHMVNGYPEPEWDAEREMVEAEPFYRYVVHDGVARAGRPDLVVDLCRDWRVFLDAGETTWPECWKGGTRCHGWSATPTRDLVMHTLGITPAEPGYASVRVAPALGDLEWARATVPTPHGFVTVEAHADGTVDIDSPVPVVRG